VAQRLSAHLNGKGTNPEIFIPCPALGANCSAQGNHEKIYQVHQDYTCLTLYTCLFLLQHNLILRWWNTLILVNKFNVHPAKGQKVLWPQMACHWRLILRMAT
jgi:hypothetical protein